MLFPYGVGPALRRAFDRGVHHLAWIGYSVAPRANPRRLGVALTKDIPYRGTGRRAHLLDVYRPLGARNAPVVIYVHGGAFSMLSKDTHRLMALAFASRGYVVFNINYRLGPRHRYPAQLEDTAAAVEWVSDHASEHGGDSGRIVLAGESAGANLVTALAYMTCHRRPEPFARALHDRAPAIRAVLAIYGLHDMHDVARLWRDPEKRRRMPAWVKREVRWAARSYVGRDPEAAPLASPLRLLAGPPEDQTRPLPPFFLTAGTADPLLDDSRRLRDVLEGRGVPCELLVYPGEIHGFNAMIWRPAARAKWRAVYGFLERHVPHE